MAEPPTFDDAFRARLHDLFVWRRDVRRFRVDPLPAGALQRLIAAACLGPSVGLSQPWRFVVVDHPARRQAVIDDFTARNAEALASYQGARAQRYARLKLAGLGEAPCQLAVFADHATARGQGPLNSARPRRGARFTRRADSVPPPSPGPPPRPSCAP